MTSNTAEAKGSEAIDRLLAAQQRAMRIAPKVGGFPVFAEVLRQAGVSCNVWILPSCQSTYMTSDGPVVQQGAPLAHGTLDVPAFDRDALMAALKADQAGQGAFAEFLRGAWNAGVVRYDVDLIGRCVTYSGCRGETYVERYAEVKL